MKKALIILAALILSLPVNANAYQGYKDKAGGQSPSDGTPQYAKAGRGKHPGKANKYRQEIKAKIQEHFKQQKEENKAFKQSMTGSDVPPEERLAAVRDHRQTQYEENVDFFTGIHEEGMTLLAKRLAENDKLTDEQKRALVNHRETQYQENTSFRGQQHNENIAFLDQVVGNPDLTPKERKTQMKEHRQEQKKENQEHRQTQREENREFRKSIRPEQPVPTEPAG